MESIKGGKYYTLQDVASKYNTYPMKVWRLCRKGLIKGTMIGNLLRFHEDDIDGIKLLLDK